MGGLEGIRAAAGQSLFGGEGSVCSGTGSGFCTTRPARPDSHPHCGPFQDIVYEILNPVLVKHDDPMVAMQSMVCAANARCIPMLCTQGFIASYENRVGWVRQIDALIPSSFPLSFFVHYFRSPRRRQQRRHHHISINEGCSRATDRNRRVHWLHSPRVGARQQALHL